MILTPDRVLRLVTDLGDSALLLPASLLLLGYFVYLKAYRTAALWGSTLVLCMGLTVLFKVSFSACGDRILPALRSPSGHTSMSMTFYICCALVLSAGWDRGYRWAAAVATGLVVAAIAVSRILLAAHTAPEVYAGLVIGTCSILWFGLRYDGAPVGGLRWQPVLGALIVLAAVTHGLHLNMEATFTRIALMLRTQVQCA